MKVLYVAYSIETEREEYKTLRSLLESRGYMRQLSPLPRILCGSEFEITPIRNQIQTYRDKDGTILYAWGAQRIQTRPLELGYYLVGLSFDEPEPVKVLQQEINSFVADVELIREQYRREFYRLQENPPVIAVAD